jgi:hypothetical protein
VKWPIAIGQSLLPLQENDMKLRRSLRMLMLPLAMLAVVVSLVWLAQISSAEQTVTVYKDPT